MIPTRPVGVTAEGRSCRTPAR